MRRRDRELTEKSQIIEVIQQCSICRIGMWDEESKMPYVVPLNFGYEWEGEQPVFYFHSAKEGRKLNLLEKNPNVCFEMDCSHELVEGGNACAYGYHFQSVMGEGSICKVEDEAEKKQALTRLMQSMTNTDTEEFVFMEQVLKSTTVLRLEVQNVSGKKNA